MQEEVKKNVTLKSGRLERLHRREKQKCRQDLLQPWPQGQLLSGLEVEGVVVRFGHRLSQSLGSEDSI